MLRIKRSVSACYTQVCSLISYNRKPTDVTVFDILFQTHFILIENTMQKDEMVDVEEAKTS
ncbi:hypothetical protein YC2023_044729 [Brassica napus]